MPAVKGIAAVTMSWVTSVGGGSGAFMAEIVTGTDRGNRLATALPFDPG